MSKVTRAINREREKLMTLDELLNSQNARPPPPDRSNQVNLSRSLTATDRHPVEKHRKKSFDASEGVLRRSEEAIQRVDDIINATYLEPDFASPVELKDEISRLQHALVDKYRGQQKLVSGAQFRSTAKELSKCEKCDVKDHMIKKAKDQIRSLKFQLSQTEDKYYSKAPRHVHEDDSETMKHLLEMTSERDALELKYQSTLQELNTLKNRAQLQEAQTGSLQTQLSSLRIEYANYQSMMEDKVNQLQRMVNESQVTIKNKDTHSMFLSKELGLKTEQIQDLEKRLQDMMEAARPKTSSESDERLRNLEQSLHAARQHENDLQSTVLHLQEQLEDGKSKFAAEELARQKAEESAQHNLNELEKYRKEIQLLEGDLQTSKTTISEHSNSIIDLKGDLAASTAANANMTSELDALKQRLADMIARFTTETERNSAMLAKSITNSVRLCVVAPTVNVHVADKKMKFRNSVPSEELSAFLEREVLSKYTFLYEQEAEGMSPVGTPIQPWITKLLSEMQASIEEHIKRAMSKNANN